MKKVCENCVHFKSSATYPAEYNWGFCTKPGSHTDAKGDKRYGVFKWADGICSRFKPKKGAQKQSEGSLRQDRQEITKLDNRLVSKVRDVLDKDKQKSNQPDENVKKS